MDLVYIPEVLTYGSFRSPQYRDYEQPWNKDYFNYGKSAQIQYSRVQQHHQNQKSLSKESCHLCRESKRRSLAAYIRGKSRSNSCQEIHEEEEERDNSNVINEIVSIGKETANADKSLQKGRNKISENHDNNAKMN